MNELKRYEEFVLAAWLGADDLPAQNLRDLFICSTGLPGETGEVCEKLKKYVRDGTLDKDALCRELGDVLYYLTAISLVFGITLEEVVQGNMDKLVDRAKRGVMRGSGDQR